jgi:serralysin
MLTNLEKYRLDNAMGRDVIDGFDSTQGNMLPLASLGSYKGFSLNPLSPIYFNASTNQLIVKQNGAVLNGFNFSGISVEIWANNVTVQNCTFDDKSGYFTVIQNKGYSGMTVQNCTFNGGDNVALASFVVSVNGYATVSNNSFIDTPSHAVQITNGVVSDNYFSGAGYQAGAHADAISVISTTGPVLISGNYIDWTNNADALAATNEGIRITTESGNTSDVTVTNNIVLGGQASIAVTNGALMATTGVFSNINVYGNYIGDYVYSAYYGAAPAGVTLGSYIDVGFANPALSPAAWSAYQSGGGVVTNNLVTATAGASSVLAAATGTTTLYGNGLAGEYLDGGKTETVMIGGAGTQFFYGGTGSDIYTYLAVADSTPQSSDAIINFNVATDSIDLHSLNASPGSATPVAFTFIGSAPFSSAGGEVCVIQNVAANQTLVEADLVGDSSADLYIRLTGLVNLTAANFDLTTAQYQADIAPFTTIASFLTSQSMLDQVAGGYSIVDSAANVQSVLGALEADEGNINAVTLTSGAISVNVATFVADQAILNDIVGGFAVADTGANVQAQMGALQQDASAIKSVTLTDSTAGSPDVLILSAANAATDAAALGKIASPYVLDATTATSATLTGFGSGLTINVGAGVNTVTGGGAGDVFYFSSNFGATEVTDFGKYASTTKADTLSLSTSDFANWSTLLADGRQVGANTVFTAGDGARLTLDGVSLAGLQHASAGLQAEFKFHA